MKKNFCRCAETRFRATAMSAIALTLGSLQARLVHAPCGHLAGATFQV
jgi:hypothetical protein